MLSDSLSPTWTGDGNRRFASSSKVNTSLSDRNYFKPVSNQHPGY